MFKFNLAFLSKMAEFKVMIYFYYTFILLILSFTIIISESKHIKLEILQFPSFELVTGIVSSHRNFTELELDYKFNDNTLITVTCVSSSPVLMVYDYGLRNLEKVYIPQVDQYIHRTFTDFWNTSTYTFKALMKTKKKMFVELGNIYCENADSEERANFHFQRVNHTLTIFKAWISQRNVKHTESHNKSCGAQIFVKTTGNGTQWGCQSKIDDRLLPTKFAYCYSAVDCANILRSVQNKETCVTRIALIETCERCRESHLEVSKLKQFHSQLAICADGQEATAAVVFFFGFGPKGTTDNHKLYLSWSEVIHPENEMLFIFPPKKTEFKVNQSAEFECHGVQHYFSFGYIFGIQVENGTIMFLQEGGPYQHHELTNARIVKEKITFRETGTTKVYCFAPVINSTEWINKSVSVNVLAADDYYYYYYDYEAAYLKNISRLKKRLNKSNSTSSIGWITITGIVAGMSILLIIIAVVSHIRIKRLKRVIIQLSEAEIQEFLEGVVLVQSSTSYDEACKTWESLPYNNMYEVPKTSLHFEENDILGAGAYGRVFKGVLTSLPAKESLDVAIKTIRPGVDVIYFKALLSELKVMAFLGNGHENLVHLKAACTEGIKNGEIFIAFELCKSNLLQVVRAIRNTGGILEPQQYANIVQTDAMKKPVNEKMTNLCDNLSYENIPRGEFLVQDLTLWSYQIADGMAYIADCKVVHGDLV
ncbi:uncharacterized protein LOC110844824 isoform X2 [Folsomia candida]|uniref:uncharacterized protein LOC110844824 isoform X2 n=1 Tax=Folsomia candida TaxID=158441 RepID=UPI0016052414|nr:uncharacterized protein LOC110844824 isoform X2 [Folsomia candida]